MFLFSSHYLAVHDLFPIYYLHLILHLFHRDKNTCNKVEMFSWFLGFMLSKIMCKAADKAVTKLT